MTTLSTNAAIAPPAPPSEPELAVVPKPTFSEYVGGTLHELGSGKLLGSPIRTVMRMWYMKSLGDNLHQIAPHDKPEYRSRAEAAWNVLLVGNGPTHGWGVATHGLGLTGQLGRALNQGTGQPVDVEYVGDELMNAATTLEWLGSTVISDFDMIVLVLSMNDAVRLTPAEKWASDIGVLLNHLRMQRAPGTPLLVVGMQPIASVHGYSNLFGMIGQHHANKLNALMEAMVTTNGDQFMHLAPGVIEPGRPLGGPATYSAWADQIGQSAIPLLPEGEPMGRERRRKQWSWDGTEKAMGWDGVDRAEPLRQLAEEARVEFKLPIAYVSVMDSEVQLLPTAHGPQATSVPRHLTYCEETVKGEGPLIVPNRRKDERFSSNEYLDITHMPFYAGKALHGRDGEVIGTFCLMGPSPRPASSVDTERLEDYAQRAQDALWAIEDGE